jgi:MerR family transcriptional regulator, heat shock protein HspR
MSNDPERRDERKSAARSEAQVDKGVKRRNLPSGMEHEEERPRYVISVAAQILHLHPQTLRLYEREGLVEPRRTGGKIRLYSEQDLDRIRRITRLTTDLGVNLAGAEIILSMRERILEMRREMDQARREMEQLRRMLSGEE